MLEGDIYGSLLVDEVQAGGKESTVAWKAIEIVQVCL